MGKAHRALVESVEPRRLLATITGQVWNDSNNDGIKQTNEKWFSLDGTTAASITVYADLNGNAVFDNGSDPKTTLTKAGSYNLSIPSAGAVAVRTHYTINTETQKAAAVYGKVAIVSLPAANSTVTQNIPLLKGAVIYGTYYMDENANNKLDGTETKRGRAQVFYDANNDGFRQNDEPFVPLGAPAGSTDFKYQIAVPEGEGNLRIIRPFEQDNLTIDPINFNAEVGKHLNRDFRLVPAMTLNGRIYLDTNGNGKRTRGEAYQAGVRVWFDENKNGVYEKGSEPSAISDAEGNFSIVTRRASALFGMDIVFRISPTMNLSPTNNLNRLIFKNLQETQTYSFGFKPASAKIRVIRDLDDNETFSSGDAAVSGTTVYVDRNRNNVQNSGDPFQVTDTNGYVTFNNLEVGREYTVRVRYSTSKNVATTADPIKFTVSSLLDFQQIVFGIKPK